MSDDKQKKPRGRPRKANTIYAKSAETPAEVPQPEPPKAEVPQPEPPKAEPKAEPPKAEPVNEIVYPPTEPVKIPIKVTKKGKKTAIQGKTLTIIDEPVKAEPPKAEPLKVDPPKELSVTPSVPVKELKGQRAPKAPKEPKPKAPPKPREPKPTKRDEDLYRMVYALQQSLQHQSRPKKKVVKYESSDTDSASSEVSEEDEPEEKYTKKIQKRLETIDNIQKRLQQAKQPAKGKYDHLSIF